MPIKFPTFNFLLFLAAAGLMFAAASGRAQEPPAPRLNRDYIRIAPPQPPVSGDKIEVIEFFYFGCPVCYELEPMLTRWSTNAPDDILLRRVPALVTASWENFARLYYTIEAFGEVARLNWPVYEAIHFDEVSLNREAEMIKWVSGKGLNAEKFLEVFRSPATTTKLSEARDMIRRFDVKGVPTIVVDRKFMTSARMAGGPRLLLPLVDKLIDMARKERGK